MRARLSRRSLVQGALLTAMGATIGYAGAKTVAQQAPDPLSGGTGVQWKERRLLNMEQRRLQNYAQLSDKLQHLLGDR